MISPRRALFHTFFHKPSCFTSLNPESFASNSSDSLNLLRQIMSNLAKSPTPRTHRISSSSLVRTSFCQLSIRRVVADTCLVSASSTRSPLGRSSRTLCKANQSHGGKPGGIWPSHTSNGFISSLQKDSKGKNDEA